MKQLNGPATTEPTVDRRTEVLKHVSKEAYGIEVGPWFNPLAPKRDGYNCLSLDIFPLEQLREIARLDPAVPQEEIPKIEDVDIIGSCTSIERLIDARNELSRFDYVISSHNLEHLPNPIKFLQGCGRVLKPGGFLSMAVPDKRSCFDFFRPHTTMGQWIEAFLANRERPTFMQVFEQNSLHSRLKVDGELRGSFTLLDNPDNVFLLRTMREAFRTWVERERNNDETYYDCHCSIFTPNSLRLLLNDSVFLGFSPFAIDEMSETNGNEFYVHLKNVGYRSFDEQATQNFYDERQLIAQYVQDEISHNSRCSFKIRADIEAAENNSINCESTFALVRR